VGGNNAPLSRPMCFILFLLPALPSLPQVQTVACHGPCTWVLHRFRLFANIAWITRDRMMVIREMHDTGSPQECLRIRSGKIQLRGVIELCCNVLSLCAW
jgi:hypothetical protein